MCVSCLSPEWDFLFALSDVRALACARDAVRVTEKPDDWFQVNIVINRGVDLCNLGVHF